MKRYAFRIQYNGKLYFGWQRQPKQISVQEIIEKYLQRLFQDVEVSIVGCGRTDAGVHASDYYFHVDLPDKFSQEILLHKMNRMLPEDIAVLSVFNAKADFHARFDATARTYHYFLHKRKNPFHFEQSLYYPHDLDYEAMNKACEHLIGTKDFTSFSKLHTDVKTNICTVTKAQWIQKSQNEWYFEIQADRFLRNMVRAVVGTLLEVGSGKISNEEIITILEKKDRGEAKLSVPGHALFLSEIIYPDDSFITHS